MACERHTVVYTCVRENSLEGVFTVAGMSNFMFYFKQVTVSGSRHVSYRSRYLQSQQLASEMCGS